jgi:F420-non-reducing hydrogenase iron-sulfur subunit
MSVRPAPSGAPLAASLPFEPVVIGFTCNWCSYRAADLAGTARIKYPPNVRLIRLMCSGRLDPTFVLKAFSSGADAVVMTGCWPEDCHYRIQNAKALRRFLLLRRVVTGLGIEPERLQRVYASAAEGQQLAEAFTRIVEEVRALGPLGWPRREALAMAVTGLAPEIVDGPGPEGPDGASATVADGASATVADGASATVADGAAAPPPSAPAPAEVEA